MLCVILPPRNACHKKRHYVLTVYSDSKNKLNLLLPKTSPKQMPPTLAVWNISLTITHLHTQIIGLLSWVDFSQAEKLLSIRA